jgi:adenosylcobinamide-GDP ribazoletransferase
MLVREIKIFLTAIMFFTRLPVPKFNFSAEYLTASARYFSLVGIIVGGLSAFAYQASALIFPPILSVMFSIIFGILITGAFHEDGFADFCDGFGGGWTKADILRIMKDSRLGTFGVLGLICILGVKTSTMVYVPTSFLVLTIISAHSVSRFAASSLLYFLPYVRADEESKTGGSGKMTLWSFLVSAGFGLAPLVFFANYKIFFLLLPILITTFFLILYFKKWLGGQTGDCAGATQQITEVVFYISFLVLCRFI